jgi:uncharacterized membrane protein
MSKERLEIFTDAVIAILMTILVLDLHAPALDSSTSLPSFVHILISLWPHFFSFSISFFALSVYWINHHYFFRYVRSVTTTMLWLNNLLLFTIAFIPFSTSLLAAEPTNAYGISTYAFVMMVAGFAFYFLRSYVYRNKLYHCEMSEAVATFGPWKSVPSIIMNALAIVTAFVSIPAALALLVLFPAFYAVPGNIWLIGFKRVVSMYYLRRVLG